MALSRRARWIGLSLVLAGALFALYSALEHFVQGPPEFASDRLLLHLLLIGIVVLVLGLLGVLVRNLVRLIVDRKHGILGSRLRTKLVFFFLGLVLLPTLVLFYGSTAVIRMTIDAMLRPALEDAVRPAQEASREGRAALRDQALWQVERGAASVASAGYLAAANWDRLQAQLQALRTEHDLRLAAVVTQPETVTSLGGGVPLLDRQALLARIQAVASAASTADEPQVRLEEVSGGLLVLAAAPISSGTPGDALVVGRWVSPAAAEALHGPVSAEDRFRALRAQRRDHGCFGHTVPHCEASWGLLRIAIEQAVGQRRLARSKLGGSGPGVRTELARGVVRVTDLLDFTQCVAILLNQ